jgi:hypothetical protein
MSTSAAQILPASLNDLIRAVDRLRADQTLFYGNRQLTSINDRIGAFGSNAGKGIAIMLSTLARFPPGLLTSARSLSAASKTQDTTRTTPAGPFLSKHRAELAARIDPMQ